LDAGPLSLAANPKESPESRRCTEWLQGLLGRRISVRVPAIADYEVRRELVRAGKAPGVKRLDDLIRLDPKIEARVDHTF